MPLTLPYSFSETATTALLVVPLKVKPTELVVTGFQRWLRISQGAYLREFDLPHAFEGLPDVRVVAPEVIITLRKQSSSPPPLWGSPSSMAPPDERAAARSECMAALAAWEADSAAASVAAKHEARRAAVREGMSADDRVRSAMEAQSRAEREAATEALFTPAVREGAQSTDRLSVAMETPSTQSSAALTAPHVQLLPPPRHVLRALLSGADADAPVAPLTVTIKHTPRFFHTPARESTREAEMQWLARNAAALPSANVDAMALKERGDAMLQRGDARGAVNAYTAALRACASSTAAHSSACAGLHANRSIAALRVCAWDLTLADCSVMMAVAATIDDARAASAMRVKAALRTALARWWSVASPGVPVHELLAQRRSCVADLHAHAAAHTADAPSLEQALQACAAAMDCMTALDAAEQQSPLTPASYAGVHDCIPPDDTSTLARVAANHATLCMAAGEWRAAADLLERSSQAAATHPSAPSDAWMLAFTVSPPLTVSERAILRAKQALVSDVLHRSSNSAATAPASTGTAAVAAC